MKKFSVNAVIASLLISSLAILLSGCARDKNKSIFSRLNGHSIIIQPDDKKWGRWISTNDKTKNNNQLSYLESCISKQFHLNLKKGQHIPFELKNEMQYLDPNPKKKNEIKLLSNGKKGSFYVTWAYTNDQKQILKLYRKLQAIPVNNFISIKGRTTDDHPVIDPDPINLRNYIKPVRSAIQKTLEETAGYKISNDEKSMINFSGTSDLKLWFNAVQDIFPKLCLSKNKTKYNFQKDGVLGQNIVKPVIKTKWFNWTLEGLVLQATVSKELDHDDYFECYVSEEYKYADDWIFIDSVLYWLGRMVPELTHDLDYYFSLSHTELFVGKTVPVTFYFNEGNKYEGITWNRTIYIKGKT